jgi:dTDP-L-rhamnose 4-epimerase
MPIQSAIESRSIAPQRRAARLAPSLDDLRNGPPSIKGNKEEDLAVMGGYGGSWALAVSPARRRARGTCRSLAETVLITGGAGFLGRYVAHALLARGDKVRVLDSLIEQVHGDRGRPAELDREVELQVGDVRDEAAVKRALEGVDSVVHLAAEVGVGQSMYEIDRYTSVNELGTAVLFQKLIEQPVRRVVVASSMSIYGEGLYRDVDGRPDESIERDPERIGRGLWDPVDAQGRP